MDRLDQLFEEQRALQVKFGMGHMVTPGEFVGQYDKIQYIKDMTLAATDELHEALNEIGWKPWATSDHINRDAYVGELVDVLHFFLNLCLVVNVTPTELFEKYLGKHEVNAKRQADGYDGVSSKCPGCHRALDDDATQCYRANDRSWCHMRGAYVG